MRGSFFRSLKPDSGKTCKERSADRIPMRPRPGHMGTQKEAYYYTRRK